MESIGVSLIEEDLDYDALPNSTVAVNMFAGALAGITEHVVMYPFDAIKVFEPMLFLLSSKTRMQVFQPTQSMYSSIRSSYRIMTANEGVRGLWRGIIFVSNDNFVLLFIGVTSVLIGAGNE